MKAGSRHTKRAGLTALAALAAAGALAAPAFAGTAPPPANPEFVEGNPSCGDYGLLGFKPKAGVAEADPTGTYPLPGTLGSVTVTENQAGTGIDWTATAGIDKVIVKGGPNANVYTYIPESFGDSNLVTPNNPNNQNNPYGLSHVEFCYDAELDVSKTAVPSFDRTFDWTIDKSLVGSSAVTTSANTVDFAYKVDVVKGAAVDSNFKVTGAISIVNPFKGAVDLVVTDDILDRTDETCTVEGGANGAVHTIPAGGVTVLDYSCTLPSKADGVNRVTIERSPQALVVVDGPLDSFDAPFAFGEPSKVSNNSVDVTDAFNGGLPELLTGGDDITESKSFTYTRTVNVPSTGCTTYPNIASITSPDGLNKSDNASVEACREVPPVIPPVNPQPQPQATPPAAILGATTTPKAKLAVTKTGPRAATAGQIVTYTITVKNTGKANATSVVLRDLLPSGYSLSGKVKGAKFTSGTLSWKFGTLAPGKSKTVKASFRINRSVGGRRCNVATAAASGVASVRDTACTRIAAVAGAIQPAVTG